MFQVLVCFFKSVFCIFLFLFLGYGALSDELLCSKKDEEVSTLHLEEIKKKFLAEIDGHYSRLVKEGSLSKARKSHYIKQYKNSPVTVYSNPHNLSQKVVYVEYEKNWWGSLYFVVFENEQISKWFPIEIYGAITTCVRWDKKGFFYQDSTHQGTKTKNTCLFQKDSVQCKREDSNK